MDEEQRALGCGWQLLIAAGVAIAVLIYFNLRLTSQLPGALKVIEEVESHSEGIFMEACVYAAYRLHPEVVERVKTDGTSFLNLAGAPPGASQSYDPWEVTPAGRAVERALGATACPRGRLQTSVGAALEKAGSYYSLSQNGEGIMVVDPQSGLAWFLYYG